MTARVEIIHGDVRDVVRGLGARRFDAVFCDPPYGLRFMGRRWDYSVPGSDVWEAIGETCKPGAPLIAFGGTRTFHRAAIKIEDGGWFPEDTIAWMYGQGKPASAHRLKPAWEPAMLFRQPHDGTVAENIARWDGVGSLAIDACRIEWGEGEAELTRKKCRPNTAGHASPGAHRPDMNAPTVNVNDDGRWPPNVILDEEAAALLDVQSGALTSHTGPVRAHHAAMGYRGHASGSERAMRADSGGASRFFYCAKVKGDEAVGNEHVTRKPVKLTTYLARLIRPQRGGCLFVPFCGSGSEIVGAIRAGWSEIIGVEIDEATVAFARERIDAELSGTTVKASRNGQPGLFGGSR